MQAANTVIFAGIGRLGVPVAEKLAREGRQVVISYRKGKTSEQTVNDLQQKFPDKIIGISAELTELKQAHHLLKSTLGQFGCVDTLINIASGYPSEKKDWKRWQTGNPITEDDWKYYESNFLSTRNTIDALLALEDNPGVPCIINFSDSRSMVYVTNDICDPYQKIGGIAQARLDAIKEHGLVQLSEIAPPRHQNPYTLAKRDIVYLTQTLAMELAGRAIRINAIAPGPMLPPPDRNEDDSQSILNQSLLKKWGHTEPVVRAVAYLLDNDFVTGETLRIDGGLYLNLKFGQQT